MLSLYYHVVTSIMKYKTQKEISFFPQKIKKK